MSDAAVAAAVEAAVGADEELRAEVGSFVRMAITESKRLMVTGSPATKVNLIRSVVPAMVKAMTVDDSADEHSVLREEFRDLMAEVRQGVYNPKAPAAPEPEVSVDAAPKKKRTRRAT